MPAMRHCAKPGPILYHWYHWCSFDLQTERKQFACHAYTSITAQTAGDAQHEEHNHHGDGRHESESPDERHQESRQNCSAKERTPQPGIQACPIEMSIPWAFRSWHRASLERERKMSGHPVQCSGHESHADS